MSESQEVTIALDGGTLTGPNEASVRAVVATLKQREHHADETKRRFPGNYKQQMTALCRSFPSLADQAQGIDPWNADRFLLWVVSTGANSGAMHAARFCLGVWNPGTDWVELLQAEWKRGRPDDREDRKLWEGLQQLKRQLRRNMQEEAQEQVRQTGRPAKQVSDADIELRALGWFQAAKRFDFVAAWGVWDDRHRRAFLNWAEYPFYP